MGSLHFAQPAFRNICNKSKHLGLFSSSRFKVFQHLGLACLVNNNVNVHSGMMIHTGLSKSVRHVSAPKISLRCFQTSSVSRALTCSRHIVQNEKLLPILDGQLCKAKYLCFINTLQHKHSFSTSCATLATRKTKKRRQELEILPFEVDFNHITQDIPVYANEGQTRFFLLVSLFGFIQFGFWAYLAHFAYTTLRDAPVKEKEDVDVETLPFWRKINLGGNKYRFGTALLCVTVGYVLLYASIFYPMRAIKHLTLLRGGRMAKITTYAPFGAYRSFIAKVEHIQSMQSRAEMKAQISLKIKNRRMFYLLDSNGKFLNTQVFDFIVGLKRQW